MKGVFITGTDTGVGKSVACGLLGHYLAKRGYKVITQKWVQTGSKDFSPDIDLHLRLMQRRRKEIKEYLPYVSPYTFSFSASAHLAAGLEKRRINPDRIKESFNFLSERFEFVIVEGIGGALVPFDRKRLLLDIVKELNLPVLIVVANKLGAINHTLLTVEAIKRRNMEIIGIVFNNQAKNVHKIILDDNIRIIKALSQETVLGSFSWMENEAPRAKARGFSERNTEAVSGSIRTLKGAVLCPRMYKNRLYREFIPIGKRVLIYFKKRLLDCATTKEFS